MEGGGGPPGTRRRSEAAVRDRRRWADGRRRRPVFGWLRHEAARAARETIRRRQRAVAEAGTVGRVEDGHRPLGGGGAFSCVKRTRDPGPPD